jgi:hypothetical protein
MVNRCKRRSVLIFFFFIQFILFSSYAYTYYQNNESNGQRTSDQSTLSPAPKDLPAEFIEKSDRSSLNKNYKNSDSQLKNDLPTNDKLESLNVSFITETDSQQTIVQCPILPTNLGHLNCSSI